MLLFLSSAASLPFLSCYCYFHDHLSSYNSYRSYYNKYCWFYFIPHNCWCCDSYVVCWCSHSFSKVEAAGTARQTSEQSSQESGHSLVDHDPECSRLVEDRPQCRGLQAYWLIICTRIRCSRSTRSTSTSTDNCSGRPLRFLFYKRGAQTDQGDNRSTDQLLPWTIPHNPV